MADRVLVVGHRANEHLFGAERSLLDLLDGLTTIGLEPVAVVPPTTNSSYADDIARRCRRLHQLPVPVRRIGKPPNGRLVARYEQLIRDEDIDVVHANTILPREPLVAGRRAGVPTVVHAREIATGDPHLEGWLGGSATQIIDAVVADADLVIGVSQAVLDQFARHEHVAVVHNAVDPGQFAVRPYDPAQTMMRVALVGSLTVRKGLLDFLDVARLLLPRVEAQFALVGPHTDELRIIHAEGRLPADVVPTGYVATPQEAMAAADIVVNLSRCNESFGRTMLEAMATGLAVVAYAVGGTPEIVVDGETGLLVPPGDAVLAAQAVQRLCHEPELRASMGAAGRRRIVERFTPAALASSLRAAYDQIPDYKSRT